MMGPGPRPDIRSQYSNAGPRWLRCQPRGVLSTDRILSAEIRAVRPLKLVIEGSMGS